MLLIYTRSILPMKNQNTLFLNEDLANKQPIVLFDGECFLCSSAVQFLIKHNHSGNLQFASLQSGTGSEIIKSAGNIFTQADSVFLLQDTIIYRYSTSALKLSSHLSFPWNLLSLLIIVPRFIRDGVYRIIAKNRYRWFGRKSFCMTDDTKYQERFLI